MPQHVYSVELEQHDRNGIPYHSGTTKIIARTGQEAVKKALTLAKGNGYLKSRPIELVSVERLIEDLK